MNTSFRSTKKHWPRVSVVVVVVVMVKRRHHANRLILAILSTLVRLGRRCVKLHCETVLGEDIWSIFPHNLVIANKRSDCVYKAVPWCNREEKSSHHVAMVAKFLNDYKPKTSLNSYRYKLHRCHYWSFIKFIKYWRIVWGSMQKDRI